MPTRLYLDTARLGLTSPGAQEAQQDFVRLAGEEGSSLYFDNLLRSGFDAWPTRLRNRYRGLRHWQGVGELKQALRRLTGMAAGRQVLLANRSAQLMRLATRLLLKCCRWVLVTDLMWPSYSTVLRRETGHLSGAKVGQVPIRAAILHDRASSDEIVDRIAAHYRRLDCDGLFLTAVSNEGIRLPVNDICRSISETSPPRFVVVDGAQAFCHTPHDLGIECCDFYLAGCHKWLRAGQFPMGLAFCPRRRSQAFIQTTWQQMLHSAELDDPLLTFTSHLERDALEPFSETVSLASLFSCRAAVSDWVQANPSDPPGFECRRANASLLAEASGGTGWQPLVPANAFRSGILLLQAESKHIRRAPAETTRVQFQEHGIALTSYENGIVRLSMPKQRWCRSRIDFIRACLRQSAGQPAHAARLIANPVHA